MIRRTVTSIGLLLVLPTVLAAAAYLLTGDKLLMDHPIAAPILWIGNILLLLWIARLFDQYPNPDYGSSTIVEDESKTRMRPDDWLIAGAFTVIALILRATYLESMPSGYAGDEGSMALIGRDYLVGKLNNPFLTGWFSFPSLYFLIPALMQQLFGNSMFAIRLASAVIGSLTVTATYWFCKRIFSRECAVIAAVLVCGNHLHIHFSRLALNNIWDGFFGILSVGALIIGLRSKSHFSLGMSGVLLGLSQYFYASTRILFVVALFAFLFSIFNRKERVQLSHILVFFGGVTAVFLPLALHFAQHVDDYLAPLNRVTIFGRIDLPNEPLGMAWALILRMGISFRAFYDQHLRFFYTAETPIFDPIAAVGLSIGILIAIWRVFRIEQLVLLLGFWGAIAIGALTLDLPASQRYVSVVPIAAILSANGLLSLSFLLMTPRIRLKRVWAYGLAACLSTASISHGLYYYFVEYLPHFGQSDSNTYIATVSARYLASARPDSQVFLLGWPRISYQGFATLPYLAPQVQGFDVAPGKIDWKTVEDAWSQHSVKILSVPERFEELQEVIGRFPNGNLQAANDQNNKVLVYLYELPEHEKRTEVP